MGLTAPEHAPRGRRPASSRETLEDAAEQLFLENGYRATTVEQITQRAGVSRNTFFNYFSAKSDLLFSGLDRAAELIADDLASAPAEEPPLTAARAALLHAAESMQAAGVPLAATQWEAMGIPADLRASGLARFADVAGLLHRFFQARAGAPGVPTRDAAYAVTAVCLAAGMEWATAGVARGPLAASVAEALDPVLASFAGRFSRSA